MSRPRMRRVDVGVFKRKLGTNTKRGVPEKGTPLVESGNGRVCEDFRFTS